VRLIVVEIGENGGRWSAWSKGWIEHIEWSFCKKRNIAGTFQVSRVALVRHHITDWELTDVAIQVSFPPSFTAVFAGHQHNSACVQGQFQVVASCVVVQGLHVLVRLSISFKLDLDVRSWD
jgi:hypothetical protein